MIYVGDLRVESGQKVHWRLAIYLLWSMFTLKMFDLNFTFFFISLGLCVLHKVIYWEKLLLKLWFHQEWVFIRIFRLILLLIMVKPTSCVIDWSSPGVRHDARCFTHVISCPHTAFQSRYFLFPVCTWGMMTFLRSQSWYRWALNLGHLASDSQFFPLQCALYKRHPVLMLPKSIWF